MADFVEIGALWKTAKGNLAGQISFDKVIHVNTRDDQSIRIVITKNNLRTNERQPLYRIAQIVDAMPQSNNGLFSDDATSASSPKSSTSNASQPRASIFDEGDDDIFGGLG